MWYRDCLASCVEVHTILPQAAKRLVMKRILIVYIILLGYACAYLYVAA